MLIHSRNCDRPLTTTKERKTVSAAHRAGTLLALAFLVRVAGILLIGRPGSAGWEGRILYSDSYSYLHAAEDLSDGRQDEPLYRLPGYPLMMLTTRGLAGPDWTATILLQQLSDLATALIVSLAALPLLGRPWSLLAGAFYLLLPSGVIYSSYLIPDIVVSMLIAMSGLLWLRTSESPGTARALSKGLLAGLCFAAGLLLKPVLLYAPSVYVALVFIPRPGRLRRGLFAAVVAAACASAYLAVRAHNMSAFGLPGMTTQDALEPMGRMVQIADYRGLGVGGATFWMFRDSLEALSAVDGEIDYGKRDSVFRAVTREAILSNPLRVAYFELSRWPKFFVNFDGHQPYLGMTSDDEKPLWWVIVTSVPQSLLGLGLLASLLSGAVRKRLGSLFWLGLAWFLYSVPVIGPIASFRYGLMFYWALVPFVLVSLQELVRRQREAIPAAQSTGRKVNP